MKALLFALDIDHTYTGDPEGFRQFVSLMKERGHRFIFATGREKWTDDMTAMNLPDIPIVFCGRDFKRKAVTASGYKVDIWIDDMPGTIEPGVFLSGDL
jgi:hypothetical protein